ncbi:hypothetical protein EOS_03025 [Caballeronia mineralivorans PML1(12)]|uniref:Uncharacterized protein n=1 Tax=Caballeronia mineralivorans PML1(12) TaxID=908627 RepID=A0A0J1D4Y8_9BURK|nr:hypothetical protein [Caballeronia mineralivorans]KLU27691.1 hypothetical protein EOS_03025 [Caballeronia mineralivorans PML1(12)]
MKKTAKPSWVDIKKHLSGFDRAGLLALVQDLYAASKENQAFLHARFSLGDDLLKPYKRTIDRWICPDVFRGQAASVSNAKKAISDYRKAVGRPEGLTELMVFYCERAAGFCADVGFEDDSFFVALVRMYEQALKLSVGLSRDERDRFLARLVAVCRVCNNFGYGVSDDMRVLFAEYVSDER